MKLPSLKSSEIKDKRVLLRLDLDVDFENGKIEDFRLVQTFPTVELCFKNCSKLLIAGHLGRPNGVQSKFTLESVAAWFSQKLGKVALKSNRGKFPGWEIGEKIFLFENLRFFKEEEKDNKEFSKELASLADVYVNDTFADSHRNHASIVGVPKLLPHFAGLHLQKEVSELSKVITKPKRPLVVVIGGEKIETKLPIVSKMHHFADYVLVGGEIAEHDHELLRIAHERTDKKSVQVVADLNLTRTDITQKSLENFIQIVKLGKMIIWNGPMGVIQHKESQRTTIELANAIASPSAYTIIGGGSTVGFLKHHDLLNKFDFVSTGGGAMLAFLAGEKLPGLEALL